MAEDWRLGSAGWLFEPMLPPLDAAPTQAPILPQVLATPEGWVRLDEAGKPVVQKIDAAFRDRLSAIVAVDGTKVPRVKMRVMSRTEPQTIVWSDAGDFSDWGEDEPEDDIMSAVRAVARGS